MIAMIRKELTNLGIRELRTEQEVDEALSDKRGAYMVVVNSVCGCAGGVARPAVSKALENKNRPDRIYTVFAGQDLEATARARSYFNGFPPSSPAIVIFKDGEVARMIPREEIQGHTIESVSLKITEAFDQIC